jgi:hypothetical protein
MRRHRHQEFIRFLNAVERAVPAGKVIHAIVDNYAAHKQPNVLKWLADHPRTTSAKAIFETLAQIPVSSV